MLCNITAIYPISVSSEHTPDIVLKITTFFFELCSCIRSVSFHCTVYSMSQTLRCSRSILRIPYPLLEPDLPCNSWRFFIHTAPVLSPYIMWNICWILSTRIVRYLAGAEKRGKPCGQIIHFSDRYLTQIHNADCHVKGAACECNPANMILRRPDYKKQIQDISKSSFAKYMSTFGCTKNYSFRRWPINC